MNDDGIRFVTKIYMELTLELHYNPKNLSHGFLHIDNIILNIPQREGPCWPKTIVLQHQEYNMVA
jgi:hypothetical protein